jgi:hypothetical protein
VRRLVLLTAVAVFAITAVAYAVTDTLDYSAKLSFKGKPTKTKPANLTYTSTLHIDTDPPGQQPETAPVTSVYFSKAIKNNAKYFPFCNRGEIDGQPTFPAKCNKAKVGTGTATALAGTPGNTSQQSVKEDLNVTVVNGPSGKNLYLVLNSQPGAPVAIQNRVVPGTLVKSSGAFGFLVRFTIPADLQEQLGLAISLTDFFVKIPSTARTVKVGSKSQKLGYLQLTSCKGSLPVKAISAFRDKDTGTPKNVTSTSSAKC